MQKANDEIPNSDFYMLQLLFTVPPVQVPVRQIIFINIFFAAIYLFYRMQHCNNLSCKKNLKKFKIKMIRVFYFFFLS